MDGWRIKKIKIVSNTLLSDLLSSQPSFLPQGLPSLTLQFGAWTTGLAADPGLRARLARGGHGALTLAAGVAAVERSVGSGIVPALGVGVIDFGVLAAAPTAAGAAGSWMLVGGSVEEEKADAPTTVATASVFSPPPPSTTILSTVLDAIEAVLGTRPSPDTLLQAAGLDSLGAVDLRDALAARVGVPLPATVALDAPTAAALAVEVDARLAKAGKRGGAAVNVVASAAAQALPTLPLPPCTAALSPASPSAPTVHIHSIACRLPCDTSPSTSLHSLASWSASGHDAVAPLPLARWDADALYVAPGAIVKPGTTAAATHASCRLAACLPSMAAFDSAPFGIGADDAAALDPHARLLLAGAAAALAGLPTSVTDGAPSTRLPISLHVGCMWAGDWADGGAARTGVVDAASPSVTTGTGGSFIAGRASFTLGLSGPAAAIDTACSSSVATLAMAAAALRTGDARGGLAAGVNAFVSPSSSACVSRLQALAPEGWCKALDWAADGYGRGEAAVVIGVAREGGPTAIATLAAVAVNQGGRASALTAPSGPAQTALLRAALATAAAAAGQGRDVAPAALALHGTGTPLGDPIELNAVAGALSDDFVVTRPPLTLLAPKAALAHTEGAAGGVGVACALAAGVSGAAAPIPCLRTLNPHVAASLADWQGGATAGRVCAPAPALGGGAAVATSSFGMSGVNGHALMVMEGGENVPPVSSLSLLWRRQRAWAGPRPSALLPRARVGPDETVSFTVALTSPAATYLHDHVVRGRALLPATAMLEVMTAAASGLCGGGTVVVAGAAIGTPRLLGAGGSLTVTVGLDDGRVKLASDGGGVHVTAMAAVASSVKSVAPPRRAALALCRAAPPLPPSLLARLASPLVDTTPGGYAAHPAPADAALHLGALRGVRVPVAVAAHSASAARCRPSTHAGWAVSTPPTIHTDGKVVSSAVWTGERGVVAATAGITAAPLPDGGAADQAAADYVYETEWVADEVVAGGDAAATTNRRLLASWSTPARVSPATAAVHSALAAVAGLTHLPPKAPVVLTTRGGGVFMPPSPGGAAWGAAAAASAAAAWSVARTAALERPDAVFAGVDGATATPPASIHGAATHGAVLHTASLTRSALLFSPSEGVLAPRPRGSFANLRPAAAPPSTRTPTPAGHVLLAVHAVGLNFRDVLNVLGLCPGDPGPPGGDVAGVVVAAGPRNPFAVGDAVFGQAAGCLGTVVLAPATCLAAMPPGVTAAQADTLPTAAATALECVGGVAATDVVLIHAAAGGLGLAAARVVAGRGASLIATAGTPAKRGAAVQAAPRATRGALSSRSTAFADAVCILPLTPPTVLLNSLTSPGMVAAGLAACARGASFVEVAKRDIWSPRARRRSGPTSPTAWWR